MDIPTSVVGFLGMAFGGISVWVQLNSRITRLEVEIKHSDKQYAQILERLKSIEDKLDHKQDRPPAG
jgi:hypothetical protein